MAQLVECKTGAQGFACLRLTAGVDNVLLPHPWVKVNKIIPEFRILRLSFHRKSASKC